MTVHGSPCHCQIIKIEYISGYSLRPCEFTQTWSIVSTPTNNNTWYMGKGCFCHEGLENSCYANFFCNNTKFILNAIGIWYNIEILGKETLPKANKI